MAINVFEGARRISMLVAVIWIIGWSVMAFGYGYDLYDNCVRVMPIRAELLRLAKDANSRGDKEATIRALRRLQGIENKPFVGDQCKEIWKEGKWWPQLLKDLGQKVFGIISGLLFLWAFTWVVGWIVRGFMGIPKGQDKK